MSDYYKYHWNGKLYEDKDENITSEEDPLGFGLEHACELLNKQRDEIKDLKEHIERLLEDIDY